MNIFDLIPGLFMLTLAVLVGFCVIRGLSEWLTRQSTPVHRRPIPSQPPPLVDPARSNARGRGVRSFYRTKDNLVDYAFSFEEQSDGTWRAYIEDQPDYRGRATDAITTHRHTDEDRRYICWDSPIPTLKNAKSIAALWADLTQRYIHTGKKFDE